nr:ATP-binding protein [Gymnodinialimonas phycosphaerae]
MRIAQVIDNLLQNAARHTDAPGMVRVAIWRDGNFAQVSTEDTPPAAPDGALPQLFDRFYRAEGSRSRALGGSGLGLPVSEAIVKAHGGTITATASDLGGLKVTFTLPETRK